MGSCDLCLPENERRIEPNKTEINKVNKKGSTSSPKGKATPTDGSMPIPSMNRFLLITLEVILKLMIWLNIVAGLHSPAKVIGIW